MLLTLKLGLAEGLDQTQILQLNPRSKIQLQFIHCNEAIYTAADAAAIFINPKARVQIQLLVL